MDLFLDNEFRHLIEPLIQEERQGLIDSLKREGNRDPIVIWKETRILLDGHNRYDICTQNNIALKAPTELSFPDRDAAAVWIIDNQLGRRNLQTFQRVVLLDKKADILERQARAKQIAPLKKGKKFHCDKNCGEEFDKAVWHCPNCAHHWLYDRKECWNCHNYTRSVVLNSEQREKPMDRKVIGKIAKLAHVGHDTVAKVRVIQVKASDEQKSKLRAGTATIHQVYTQIKRQEIKEAVAATDWPTGKYRVIYADPPWKYSNSMPMNGTTQPEDHYGTMTPTEIAKLPVIDIALDDAVLFLWVTSPVLEQSFDVINGWGFKYKASFVWDKVKHNMGHYNSVRHEFLLVAVRGSCQPDIPKLFDSVQVIERTEHSVKPSQFRDMIQSLYPHGPRIELFARNKPDGWEVYGNAKEPALLSTS